MSSVQTTHNKHVISQRRCHWDRAQRSPTRGTCACNPGGSDQRSIVILHLQITPLPPTAACGRQNPSPAQPILDPSKAMLVSCNETLISQVTLFPLNIRQRGSVCFPAIPIHVELRGAGGNGAREGEAQTSPRCSHGTSSAPETPICGGSKIPFQKVCPSHQTIFFFFFNFGNTVR